MPATAVNALVTWSLSHLITVEVYLKKELQKIRNGITRGEMSKPLLGKSESELSYSELSGMTVGILGSGDFARSLATCLVCSGFKVVVGSRNPKISVALFPATTEVTTQENAVNKTDVIFVAVFREHYSTLCDLKEALAGKILVDVSNSTELNHHHESNAEYLASLFPKCMVVKGFNVISAWALQSGPKDGNKQVLVCSDNKEARGTVCQIARSMGFIPVDMGSLSSAREIENTPLRLFPSWKTPLMLSLGLFVFFYAYNFTRSVIHPYVTKGEHCFYKMPIELVNVTLPCVAYVMLSLVYLPGVLAAFLQLRYGTKYRRFPGWLDQWLKHRKQIGLLSFLSAALHAVYSLCLPMRRSARYLLLNAAFRQVKDGVENTWVEEEVWRMELYISLGILALAALSLLAVASLPSVGNSLNWREFSFIQIWKRLNKKY
ncbi:metalloreductase STEAP3-like isoform X3 [Acipenser ruthenus]|uniref:metalloreductase STEAP3-like isoform X3 n=1 Tax=Acipenser ruthenus TaxID=7906 RepID=UPI002740CF3D|nr:metalloreductase STEAP3-like isoform X3 [Acipenser ruthenus]